MSLAEPAQDVPGRRGRNVESAEDAPGQREVCAFLRGRPLVVLTGAGMSTDSGIPDYRGPNSPNRLPMTYG